MENTDVSEMLIVVRLNCGEPVSVSASHEELEGIPVVFVESSEMADELEEAPMLDTYEIIAKADKVSYEDMEEFQDQLEDNGVVF